MDSIYLAGDFLYDDVPQGKEYYTKYFNADIEKRFLIYYFYFREICEKHGPTYFKQLFIDHTGRTCKDRWFFQLLQRVKIIESELNDAMRTGNMEKSAMIRSGKFNVK